MRYLSKQSQGFTPTPNSKQFLSQGFSLIEVLVTMAIVTIITTVVMIRYGSFNSAVLLKNQAFEMALDVREAQVFAISVRGAANKFREEYGVYFGNTNATNRQQYRIWLDDDSNANNAVPFLHTAPNDETIEIRKIDERFSITDICFNQDSSCGARQLHISFARPDFDAKMLVVDSGSNAVVVNDARVEIGPSDGDGARRSIIITNAGQITVE